MAAGGAALRMEQDTLFQLGMEKKDIIYISMLLHTYCIVVILIINRQVASLEE